MAPHLLDELADVLATGDSLVVRLPALLKGRLLLPPRYTRDELLAAVRAAPGGGALAESGWLRLEGAQILHRRVHEGATRASPQERRFLVLPSFEPRELIEMDRLALARELHALPFREVLDYAEALREALRETISFLGGMLRHTHTSHVDERGQHLLWELLPELLDPRALGEAVDRDLAGPEAPGRHYLDGWIPVEAPSQRGMSARMAERISSRPARASMVRPTLRAIPTRQLHITAGNSPLVPFLSFLRALATKGAAVIKSPADATAIPALLAMAMRAVDADHPITRHTSLVYWKGGDRHVEDVLLSPSAFDRLVVWGSAQTVRSLGERAGHMKSVFLEPRYGSSLIGRRAFPHHLEEAAELAATDSMIANQQACTASLVHYVEGTEEEALAYCRALQRVLARWDELLPHRWPPSVQGRLRQLRRGEFLRGTWFVNGGPRETSSVVISMPGPFDITAHPACRCIVVRRVEQLGQVLPLMSRSVSTVGVYPEETREEWRDALAAAGVSNILPLGECERAHAGMPHDGMRVMSELVEWTNG
ncbi:MAG TPA: acyl-CoA reductase [Archangium sp.]|nr:acyl-CoA reductase [Archangium sp.]